MMNDWVVPDTSSEVKSGVDAAVIAIILLAPM